MRTDPTVNQELINRNSCNHKPDGPDGVGWMGGGGDTGRGLNLLFLKLQKIYIKVSLSYNKFQVTVFPILFSWGI